MSDPAVHVPAEHYGVVRKVEHAKCWGFLRSDAGDEVFFHKSVIHGTPWELVEVHMAVRFTYGAAKPGAKGPRAAAVWFNLGATERG